MAAEGNDRPDGPVLSDAEGGYQRKSNVLRRSFRPMLARANLPPIRPYDRRLSGAALLLLAGEDTKIVSERLGIPGRGLRRTRISTSCRAYRSGPRPNSTPF